MKQTSLKTARPESPLYGRGLGEASYFTIQELAKSATAERLAIDNTPPRAARKMLTILVEQLLDPIRRRYGSPIIVTSGYRCPALNTAVGGVANSHHIVGCAADIKGTETPSNLPLRATLVTPPSLCDTPSIDRGGVRALQISRTNNSCEHPEGAPHRGGAVQRTEGVCRGGSPNLALFHLIIQMQREGAIRFTQLIAEEGYRWLHISYVPGMLRNQIIDVNTQINADVNADAKRASVATAAGLSAPRSATCSLKPSGRQLTSSSSSTSKKDYQDSG